MSSNSKKISITSIETEEMLFLRRQVARFFCDGVIELAKEVSNEAIKKKAIPLFVDLGARPLSFPFLFFSNNHKKLNFFYGSSRTLGSDLKNWIEWDKINGSIPSNKKLIIVDDVTQSRMTIKLLSQLAEIKNSKIISVFIYNQSKIGKKYSSIQEIELNNHSFKVNLLGLNFIRGFDYFYIPGKGSYVRRKNIGSFRAEEDFNICTLYKMKKQIDYLPIKFLKNVDWCSDLLKNIWPMDISRESKKHIIINLEHKFPISPLDFYKMKVYYTNEIWQKFSDEIKKIIKEHI